MSAADRLAAALRRRLPGWKVSHRNIFRRPDVLRLIAPDHTGAAIRAWDRRLGNEAFDSNGVCVITWSADIPEHRGPGGLDRLAAYLRRCVEAPAESTEEVQSV